jgi:hypothetical protein
VKAINKDKATPHTPLEAPVAAKPCLDCTPAAAK